MRETVHNLGELLNCDVIRIQNRGNVGKLFDHSARVLDSDAKLFPVLVGKVHGKGVVAHRANRRSHKRKRGGFVMRGKEVQERLKFPARAKNRLHFGNLQRDKDASPIANASDTGYNGTPDAVAAVLNDAEKSLIV